MEWMERMNAALDYIEENLAGDLDLPEAAKKAGCTEYHFSRIFSFIAGLPLNEYIRKRRLTLAGYALQRSTDKVIDIANRFGYTSPNSFTRAFQEMHGILPSEAREVFSELNTCPRLSFTLSVNAAAPLNPRIVREYGFTVFGRSVIMKSEDAGRTVPAFWNQCEAEHVTNRIVAAAGGNERTLLNSVLTDGDGTLQYMICLNLPKGGVPDEFETAAIPERTWAVFPLVINNPGEDSIRTVWKRIYTEWFPNADYEQDIGPRQERCRWMENGKMLVEAWVPVIKGKEKTDQSGRNGL